MPKIVHAADFHLDSAFGGLPTDKARERRRESRELADRLADLVRAEEAEIVLLAGDLFDGERVFPETLERLKAALASMGCPVFIAPGNHDPYTPHSPYAATDWPENVHIFHSEAIESVLLPDLACVVHGAAFTSPERTSPPLAGFSAPEDGRPIFSASTAMRAPHPAPTAPSCGSICPPAVPVMRLWGTSISTAASCRTATPAGPIPAVRRAGDLMSWETRAYWPGRWTGKGRRWRSCLSAAAGIGSWRRT